MHDLKIHLHPSANEIYHRQPAFRWSDALRRWCVFSPELIREIMRDRRFAVPSYDLAPLQERFGIDLSLTQKVLNGIPLANEGEAHRLQRSDYARDIMAHSLDAKAAFSAEFAQRLALLDKLTPGTSFCLVADLVRPASRAMISALVGIPVDALADVETVPLSFDDSVSIKRRQDIELLLRKIESACPHPDPLPRLGIIMVSANTLLGSLVRSLSDQLNRNPEKLLSEITWPRDLPCTSLSLIEKVCVADAEMGQMKVRRGDRLRLYIEASGIDAAGNHVPSDLFYAVGPHRCVGMSLSVAIWNCMTQLLSARASCWQVVSTKVRLADHVFHFPEEVLVVANANRF